MYCNDLPQSVDVYLTQQHPTSIKPKIHVKFIKILFVSTIWCCLKIRIQHTQENNVMWVNEFKDAQTKQNIKLISQRKEKRILFQSNLQFYLPNFLQSSTKVCFCSQKERKKTNNKRKPTQRTNRTLNSNKKKRRTISI